MATPSVRRRTRTVQWNLTTASLRRARESRRYPRRPVLGVGALVFRRGRVLLVERARAPLKGYWSLPGGVLEPGETLADGIRREVLEETGLCVQPLQIAGVFERIIRDGAGRLEYHYVLVDFLCRFESGTLCAADDARRAEWVRMQDLERLLLTEGSLDLIRESYAKLKRRTARV